MQYAGNKEVEKACLVAANALRDRVQAHILAYCKVVMPFSPLASKTTSDYANVKDVVSMFVQPRLKSLDLELLLQSEAFQLSANPITYAWYVKGRCPVHHCVDLPAVSIGISMLKNGFPIAIPPIFIEDDVIFSAINADYLYYDEAELQPRPRAPAVQRYYHDVQAPYTTQDHFDIWFDKVSHSWQITRPVSKK